MYKLASLSSAHPLNHDVQTASKAGFLIGVFPSSAMHGISVMQYLNSVSDRRRRLLALHLNHHLHQAYHHFCNSPTCPPVYSMYMKGKDKEDDDSRHDEGSPVAPGKKKRPLLYEGPIASILNALFIRTRFDFPPEAFHRTKGGTKEKPIQFTPSQIAIRHRILDDMLAASSMRDKEIAEVVLNTSEMLLVQQEFEETVNESGVVMLLEYYDYAQRAKSNKHQCAAAAALGPNAAGLKRADCIMLIGGISMIHLSSITKGFNVTLKHGFSRIVLLSFDAEDANLQRQEIQKRAARKGYTYSIRVEHEVDPQKAKAFAEVKQMASSD